MLNGKHQKLSGYQLSLLPTGYELLKRDDRENDQIDTLIELNNEDRFPFWKDSSLGPAEPCPSLAQLLNYSYKGDELHSQFCKELDNYSVVLRNTTHE